MEKVFGIFVLEDFDGQGQFPAEVLVDHFHEVEGQRLVMYVAYEHLLEYVRVGAVPQVVHQDSGLGGFHLGVEKEDAFAAQGPERLLHQVAGTDGVLLPRVLGSGVDHAREA